MVEFPFLEPAVISDSIMFALKTPPDVEVGLMVGL